MIFDSEFFAELMSKLKQDERDAVDELLELLNVIIEDFVSVKSAQVLQFRIACLSSHFIFFMEQLVELSMGHGLDFNTLIQDLPKFMQSNTDDIHDSDLIEPASKVELTQVNSVMARSVDVAMRVMSETDFYDDQTKEIRDGLMREFRDCSGRVNLLLIAVGVTCSEIYNDVPDETIPLLIEALVRQAGYLSDVLARMDELVTPDEIKLTPIAELFEEPNDE